MIIIKRLGSPRKETRKVYNIILVYVGVRTTSMRPLRLTVITTLYTTTYINASNIGRRGVDF